MIGEILPELWIMKRYDFQTGGALVKDTVGDLAVITPRRGRRTPGRTPA